MVGVGAAGPAGPSALGLWRFWRIWRIGRTPARGGDRTVIRFAARRLGFMLLILVVSSVIVFVVGRLAPGDPVQLLMGDLRDPVVEARVRRDLGLDRPLWAQYLRFAGRALRGDLGQSYANPGRSVNRMVAEALPATARLAAVTVALAILLGVPLGVLSAVGAGVRDATSWRAWSRSGACRCRASWPRCS